MNALPPPKGHKAIQHENSSHNSILWIRKQDVRRDRVWGFQQRMFSIGKCAFINLKTYNKVICCGLGHLAAWPAALRSKSWPGE